MNRCAPSMSLEERSLSSQSNGLVCGRTSNRSAAAAGMARSNPAQGPRTNLDLMVAIIKNWPQALQALSTATARLDALGNIRRPGNEPGTRVRRWLVEPEKGEQVRQILLVERRFDSFRHHRKLADAGVFHLMTRHDFFTFARHAHHDALVVVL